MRRPAFQRLSVLFALIWSIWAHTGPAEARPWRYRSSPLDERFDQRFRFNGRLGVWIANFNRSTDACLAFEPSGFCPTDSSDEIAVTASGEASYRIITPLHLTVGLVLAYSAPEMARFESQVVAGVPFGLTVTWHRWPVRPILRAQIMPVLFITDGNRDYTLGGGGGVAVRLGGFGDLSVTVGHHRSMSLKHTAIELGVHPFL